MYLLDNRRCPQNVFFYFSGLFMVKHWHFPYLKSHSMYEVYRFLKITALFTCLIVSYTFESNNSDRKMKFCFFFYIVASIELMKTLWFFGRHFPKFMENEYLVWHSVDTWTLLPSIIVQRTKKIVRIIFGFWAPICPKIGKGTLFFSSYGPSLAKD